MNLQDQYRDMIDQLDDPAGGPLDLIALQDLLVVGAKTLRANEVRFADLEATNRDVETERERFRGLLRDDLLQKTRAMNGEPEAEDRIRRAGTFSELSALRREVLRNFETAFRTAPTIPGAGIAATPGIWTLDIAAYRV